MGRSDFTDDKVSWPDPTTSHRPNPSDHNAPSCCPRAGQRDGATFNPLRDTARLNKQAQDVFDVMIDGAWHSLSELAAITGHPEASISARIRDFRKPRFGGFRVDHECLFSGFWLYRLVLNSRTCTLTEMPLAR